MTCTCTHIALAHQYRASTAANDGECLAPQCPCGGYESGESALEMGGLGVAAWDNSREQTSPDCVLGGPQAGALATISTTAKGA